MERRNPLAPKAILATILISFAMVGVAIANGGLTVSISSPTDGQYLNNSKPTFVYSYAGGVGPYATYCNFDGPTGGPTSSFGLVSCPASGAPVSNAIADGGHRFNVMAEDSNGATQVASRAFVIDTIAPTVNITSPVNGSTIVDETPTIAFNSPDGQNPTCSFDGAAASACDVQFTSIELSQGTHTLTVSVTDLAGNVGSATVTFTIDLSAPLEDPLPPDSANVTKGKSKLASNGVSLFVPVKALILPSPDVSPKVACKGKVSVSIKPKVRRARTFKRSLKLARSGSRCKASGKIAVPRRYKGKRATLRMRFPGNDYMSGISVVKTVTL